MASKMVLCDEDLEKAIETGDLVVNPFHISQLGPTSIDLHISSKITTYTSSIIHLGRTNPQSVDIEMDGSLGYILQPSSFIIGSTLEHVYISPRYQGWIETKGDIARAGLQVHNSDGHIDPGFSGTITLEITNLNSIPIVIYPSILICQLFIFELKNPCKRPYRGKYLGQHGPTVYIPSNQYDKG